MNKEFEYTFLKSELTLEIILIIKIESEWINQEIEIEIEIQMKEEIEIIINNQIFKSGKLPYIISNWLKNNLTNVYFANEEGSIVSEAIIGEF